MSEGENSDDFAAEANGQSVIAVRADMAQAVLDFIAALEREDADDVSGYMLAGVGAIRTSRSAAAVSGTGGVWDPVLKRWEFTDLD